MKSMPSTRRAKTNGAEQTSASHAKGPAAIIMIDLSSPLAWKRSPRRETLFDFAIRSSGDAYDFAPRVERDRALREDRHHIWGEPDILGDSIEGQFRIGRHLFRL